MPTERELICDNEDFEEGEGFECRSEVTNKDLEITEVEDVSDLGNEEIPWVHFGDFFKFISREKIKKIIKVECLNCIPKKNLSVSLTSSYNMKKHLEVYPNSYKFS